MPGYNQKQRDSIDKIRGTVKKLIEIEDLNKRRYQPIINLDDAIDAAVSDISLDNLPPYESLESRLRKEISDARELGLGEDPFVKRIGNLAFN